jgi:hypothetical protein
MARSVRRCSKRLDAELPQPVKGLNRLVYTWHPARHFSSSGIAGRARLARHALVVDLFRVQYFYAEHCRFAKRFFSNR